MKRPMLFCGLCALCCSVAALLLSKVVLIILSIIFAVLFLSALLIKRLHFTFLAFLICLFISIGGLSAVLDVEKAYAFNGEVTLNGTVCDINASENGVSYTVKLKSIQGAEQNFKIRLNSSYSLYLKVGDKISARAILKEDLPDKYMLSKRIYRNADFVKLYSHTSGKDINSFLCELRDDISHFFLNNLRTREASVMLGLTTGDTGYIDDGLYENIRRSGVSHVIVVSGMHLSIIAGAFLKLAKRARLPLKTIGIFGFLVIFSIVAVTGFSVSALRASAAFVIMFIGYFLGRKPDSLNSLFTAVTFLCLENPFVAGSISFQLSTAATFGIIVLAPLLLRNATANFPDTRIAAIARGILSVLFSSLSATLMTMPFVIGNFGTFSIISLITNIIICYPVSYILILCVIALMCFKFEFLYRLILLVAGLATKAIIFVVDSLACLPFAVAEPHNPLPAVVISSVLVGLAELYCFINIDKRSVQSSGDTD